MKTIFELPKTKTCIVVWYRNGVKGETLINTPANCDRLRDVMLGHRVGYSEIRTIKSVNTADLARSMMSL